jgi:hypothetical protein
LEIKKRSDSFTSKNNHSWNTSFYSS